MNAIDLFASEMFEAAKRFLEKAKETDSVDGKKAFLYAALLIGMSSLEAHLNAIADEMAERPNLSILDRSILQEKDYIFQRGEFKLTGRLKMYNLLDRFEYLFCHFALPGKKLDIRSDWWGKLNQGIDLRNSIVHPKEKRDIDYQQVESTFEGTLAALDTLYLSLYDCHFPAIGRRFDSKMEF